MQDRVIQPSVWGTRRRRTPPQTRVCATSRQAWSVSSRLTPIDARSSRALGVGLGGRVGDQHRPVIAFGGVEQGGARAVGVGCEPATTTVLDAEVLRDAHPTRCGRKQTSAACRGSPRWCRRVASARITVRGSRVRPVVSAASTGSVRRGCRARRCVPRLRLWHAGRCPHRSHPVGRGVPHGRWVVFAARNSAAMRVIAARRSAVPSMTAAPSTKSCCTSISISAPNAPIRGTRNLRVHPSSVPEMAQQRRQVLVSAGSLTAAGSGLAIGRPMNRRALSPMKS